MIADVPNRPKPPTSAELESIVAQLQEGTDVEESFRRLFDHFYGPVFHFFSQRGFSPEESLDLTQEVFLSVYRNIRSYRAESSLRRWLLGVMANVYRNELRRRHTSKRSVQEVPFDEDREDLAGPDPNPEALSRQAIDRLEKAVRELPPQMRRVLILRVYHGHRYQEIADLLGLSIHTVKSHLAQARQRLRDRVESRLRSPTPNGESATQPRGAADEELDPGP